MTKDARMTREFREDEVTCRRLFVIWALSSLRHSSFVIRHWDFIIDPANPARDWLPGEGPCEILPVGAVRPSAGPPRVPAARDWDLNYSLEKERTPMPVEQKMGAVS
jgi:hypothetical protein